MTNVDIIQILTLSVIYIIYELLQTWFKFLTCIQFYLLGRYI